MRLAASGQAPAPASAGAGPGAPLGDPPGDGDVIDGEALIARLAAVAGLGSGDELVASHRAELLARLDPGASAAPAPEAAAMCRRGAMGQRGMGICVCVWGGG